MTPMKNNVITIIKIQTSEFRERMRTGIILLATFLLFFFLFANLAKADELVGWETAGLGGYGASPLTPATVAPNLTAVGLTRGSGVGTGGSAAANAWGGTSWDTGNSTAAIAVGANDFATFSVTANTGYKVSFTTIPAYNIRRSATGPTMGQWQYQVGLVAPF